MSYVCGGAVDRGKSSYYGVLADVPSPPIDAIQIGLMPMSVDGRGFNGVTPVAPISNSTASILRQAEQESANHGYSSTAEHPGLRGGSANEADMTDFSDWCTPGTLVPIGGHRAAVLESYDDAKGSVTLAASLPNAYAKPDSLVMVAEQFGKKGVAKFLRNKLPTKASARSGDMGEILATAYLHQERGYVVGPSRLIQRDHQEWAMRGDDVLGAMLDSKGQLRIAKAEAKSRATLGAATVKDARQGLARNDELPSPHSLTQFAERLLPTADSHIGEAVLRMQLSDGVRPDRVGHLMFLFTGSDPSAHVEADLKTYSGPVSQLTVTLRVTGHQGFIKDAYDGVTTGGS